MINKIDLTDKKAFKIEWEIGKVKFTTDPIPCNDINAFCRRGDVRKLIVSHRLDADGNLKAEMRITIRGKESMTDTDIIVGYSPESHARIVELMQQPEEIVISYPFIL